MPAPFNLAAIDAGSNAIRLVIARSNPVSKLDHLSPRNAALRTLEVERYALRLGRHVFIEHRFDRQTIEKAVQAFRHFRSLMDLHNVRLYRAVATSATREARNRRDFIERIYEASGIHLEVIDGAEEARLVRCGVAASVAGKTSPRLIADLGGGSLEINLMKAQRLDRCVALPVGTVRMMETFGIQEAITAQQAELMKSYVLSLLHRNNALRPLASHLRAVACGGNAEALAVIAPGRPKSGIRTLDLKILRRQLPRIIALNIRERMRAFGIRKDRAEVIGIAAVILETLGWWWKIDQLLVPGVGVKEGLLVDLVDSVAGANQGCEGTTPSELLLSSVRRFAARFDRDPKHAEQVSKLAVSVFDQLLPLHKLDRELRIVLEAAALLHDCGSVIHQDLHHRHGEYLVRYGDIAGFEPGQRKLTASLIRYHGEPNPDSDDKNFASLPRKQQVQIRSLVSILRVADALDSDRRQGVTGLKIRLANGKIYFNVQAKYDRNLLLWAVRRRAALFESVFDRPAEFKCIA